MNYKGGVVIHQEWTAWMNVENPDMSVDEAVAKLKDLGNDILEIDYDNRRIKVMHETSDKGGVIHGSKHEQKSH